jgi:uncharacterized membrane protein
VSSAQDRVRVGSVVCTTVLVAIVIAWIIEPAVSGLRIGIAALVTLPLWAWTPALWRGSRKSFAAMTLCVVPYMVGALTELIANPDARVWASTALLVAFTLFVLLIVFLRLTRAHAPTT